MTNGLYVMLPMYLKRLSSLISEGRLCDAGYSIYKNKDFVHVRDKDKVRVVLRGVRANKLWVFTIDGNAHSSRPVNTIIPTKSSSIPPQLTLMVKTISQNQKANSQKPTIEGQYCGRWLISRPDYRMIY